MRGIKTFIIIVLSCLLISSTALAKSDLNDTENGPLTVINSSIKSLNNQNYIEYASLWDVQNQATLIDFINNEQNKTAKLGLLNVKKASLISLKEFDVDTAVKYVPNIDRFIERFGNIKIYYTATDYKVYSESKYKMDGINYEITVFVKENGAWKISQQQVAPVDLIVADNDGFSSEDELITSKQFSERKNGNFLNKKGQVIESNRATANQLDMEQGVTDSQQAMLVTNDHLRPSTIRVYMSTTWNKAAWSCALNCVKSVDFLTYIKDVLPNEWGPTWASESLKAGAMVVKMYGWFATYSPLAWAVNADVYDDTRSQVYLAGTNVAATNSAINGVGSLGIDKTNGSLFLTEYRAGTYDSAYQSSGYVRQNGSKYWADNSKTWTWILEYYYNGSTVVGGSTSVIDYFAY